MNMRINVGTNYFPNRTMSLGANASSAKATSSSAASTSAARNDKIFDINDIVDLGDPIELEQDNPPAEGWFGDLWKKIGGFVKPFLSFFGFGGVGELVDQVAKWDDNRTGSPGNPVNDFD